MKSLIFVLFIILGFAAEAGPPPTSPTNQAWKAVIAATSNTVNLPGGVTVGIYIGDATACNIAVILANDTSAVTFTNVQSGAIIPFRVKRVMVTNTNCTSIIALYDLD